MVGGVPAPSEIAAGVPGDLDAICRLTLNDDEGPLLPATSLPRSRRGRPRRSAASAAPPAPCWSRAARVRTRRSPSAPGRPQRRHREDRADPHRRLNPAKPGPTRRRRACRWRLPTCRRGRRGAAGGDARPAAALGAAAPPGEQEPAPGSGAPATATASAVAGAVGTALGTAGHAAGHAAGAAAGRVGSFARAAADKAVEKRAARAAAAAEERGRHARRRAPRGYEDSEPPLPMLPPETADAPTRDQSKLVMAIMAGFLAFATLVGFWGVSQIGAGEASTSRARHRAPRSRSPGPRRPSA